MQIRKHSKQNNLKVPHISWNEIFFNDNAKDTKKINKEILNKSYYFVLYNLAIIKKKKTHMLTASILMLKFQQY